MAPVAAPVLALYLVSVAWIPSKDLTAQAGRVFFFKREDDH
jgi:hypothetical protein